MIDRVPSGVRPEEDFIGKYARANVLHRRLLDGYFAAVSDLVQNIPPAEIRAALEVGCGVGYSTERLRLLLSPTVKLEASEYLDWQVKEAQERLPNIAVVQEDVYHLDRDDQSLDLIFLLEVLEHLDDVPAALKELRRVAGLPSSACRMNRGGGCLIWREVNISARSVTLLATLITGQDEG